MDTRFNLMPIFSLNGDKYLGSNSIFFKSDHNRFWTVCRPIDYATTIHRVSDVGQLVENWRSMRRRCEFNQILSHLCIFCFCSIRVCFRSKRSFRSIIQSPEGPARNMRPHKYVRTCPPSPSADLLWMKQVSRNERERIKLPKWKRRIQRWISRTYKNGCGAGEVPPRGYRERQAVRVGALARWFSWIVPVDEWGALLPRSLCLFFSHPEISSRAS